MQTTYDCAIIGGGIVGLATAMELSSNHNQSVLLIEKEDKLALHQTGRNSGVIHSGIYYKPGSAKARMCLAGCASMVAFCQKHDIPHDVCGKVIAATDPGELEGLRKLRDRGLEHGIEVRDLTPGEARAIEPELNCIAGVFVPTTGITDYKAVASKYAQIAQEHGAVVKTGTRLVGMKSTADGIVLETTAGEFLARKVINCAGLQSDRVARISGAEVGMKIVPFRGDYYTLKADRAHLVKGLIYPVPNPDFPFLGVHLTKMIDGSVHAGPNAVLSLKREGYSRTAFSLADTLETLTYPGFRKLAKRHMREGMAEISRAFSKRRFTQSLQRLVPGIVEDDLEPCKSGIRAQAITAEGNLVDDFAIIHKDGMVHVCNAPSPAATSSLEIGKEIAARAYSNPA